MKRSAILRRTPLLFGVLVIALSPLSSRSSLRANAQQPPAQAGAADISAEALAQISALMQEKASRTGVELKIDSQLIYELKMQEGRPIAAGVPFLETDIPYADDGHAVVDVKARMTSNLTERLNALGAEVLSSTPDGSGFRIHIDVGQVRALAASPDVVFIQPKQDAITSRLDVTNGQKRQTLAVTGQGSRSSEGDVTHRAFAARGAFHADGAGVKIGVLSNGVTNLAASQAAGDLGAVTILPGQAGSGDEGTAILEIIHDLAPGAQLYFATAFNGIASFAQNIRDLRAAGCDIIIDDVFYFVETPFQDGQAPGVISNTNGGVVIQAVKDVTASGALYFSSAGNAGNLDDGTSGVWEGNFVDGGRVTQPILATEGPAARLHSFGGQTFNVLTANGSVNNLYWSDPLGGSSNDYDLFRLNAAGRVDAASLNVQDGTQDPYEQVSAGAAGARLVVVKFSGAGRFLHLNTNRGRLSIATAGQTHGHAATNAPGSFGVAATPAGAAFPGAFGSTNAVETFSSDGPRRIFFRSNGAPITPGDFSSTGGQLLAKPDITAADGVSVTGVGGFPTIFFGTSAAAPHAAAIAGLIKSANASLTSAQIRAALEASAIDIEAPGTDRDSGAGIVMAFGAMQSIGAAGTAFLTAGPLDVIAAEHPGNGNGAINAGEGAQVVVRLRNLGVADATGISTTLTTSTPNVTLTLPAGSAYPDIAAETGSDVNITPFLFTVASDTPCQLTADFTLTASYSGGGSPAAIRFQVPIGPSFSITRKLDGSTPAATAGATTSTGVQGTRHFRDGVASTCGAPKAFPGTTAPGNRQFDAYTFNLCAEAVPSCATVTLQGPNAGSLFSAAYVPSFNPGDLSENYRADAGASDLSRTYSFPIGRAGSTVAVEVYDVPPADPPASLPKPSKSEYTLTVSGVCAGACTTPNAVPVAKARRVTVFADSSCSASASIDDGSSDPDRDPLAITQSPAGPYPLGTTDVLLTVTDPKGATSQATATVTVLDKTSPAIDCPASIVVNKAPGSCSAPVTFALPAVSDACSLPVSVVTSIASGSLFPIGTTPVTGTATDASGNSATCPFTVTVLDNEPPVIACPAPIVSNTAPGACSAPVAFPLPAASDACSTPVSVATSLASGSRFAIGTTPVTGTATDAAGNSATCPFTVTVVDNEPPSVSSFSLSAPPLWPPNHRMVDVTVNYAWSDNCDAASCVLAVSSNEPENGLGDGDTDHDWEVVDARHVRVRAERSGKGNGRTYTVTLTCTDAAGNKTVRTGTLTVPHNR